MGIICTTSFKYLVREKYTFESMAKCTVCGQKMGFGERISFPQENIIKVCEHCLDTLLREKGYAVNIAPEHYKIYVFDDGVKYRQYIPRGPASHLIPNREERELRDHVVIDMLNRKIEVTAKRIEQRSQ